MTIDTSTSPSTRPSSTAVAMPSLRARTVAAARAAATREPGLIAVGIAGIGVAAVCAVGVAFWGRYVPPEGKLLDAATFTFGVGVFTLTIALLLPLAGYSPSARRRWRRAFYIFVVYGLVLESLQAFRGLDPRFTEVGDPIDEIAGAVFGVTAAFNTVLFVLLGLRFFRSNVLVDRPILRAGIRYGVVAVALSFGVGIVMSVNSGREIGEDGDLLLAHALGVHGLQALPLVALLVATGAVARPSAWVHWAGGCWLAACSAALLQAVFGEPPFEWSVFTAAVLVGLAGWAVSMARAIPSSIRVPATSRQTSVTSTTVG
jgi:hypothetical protein